MSNTPFREYKHWEHEGGISTPLIAHWPAGIAARAATASSKRSPRISSTSWPPAWISPAPTYPAEFNGHDDPADGRRESRAARSPASRWTARSRSFGNTKATAPFAWATGSSSRSIPVGWELYDMAADRTEMNDLAAQQPERVRGNVRALGRPGPGASASCPGRSAAARQGRARERKRTGELGHPFRAQTRLLKLPRGDHRVREAVTAAVAGGEGFRACGWKSPVGSD